MWLALLFGISAAAREEDLSCKVTVFWREFLITSHAAMVSSWAYLPVSRSSPAPSFCFVHSSLLSLHTREVFCLPALPHSSPQFHICFEHLSSANSTWLCPLVFAKADGSGADKSNSITGCGSDARGLAWSHPTGTDARTLLSPPPPKKSQYQQLSPAKRMRWRGR